MFDALQVFLLLLFCPINVVYRSSRFQFLRILRNIVLSPLYKVQHQQHCALVLTSYSLTRVFALSSWDLIVLFLDFLQVVMVDFFMADQLCSQVPVHN